MENVTLVNSMCYAEHSLEKTTHSHQVVTSNNDEIIQIDTTIDDQSGEELDTS